MFNIAQESEHFVREMYDSAHKTLVECFQTLWSCFKNKDINIKVLRTFTDECWSGGSGGHTEPGSNLESSMESER